MASLFRGYVHQLKTRPVGTNLATAAVLMTAGDVMAQVIERWHLEDEFTLHDPSDLEGVPTGRRLHLRTYWTRRLDTDGDEGENGDGREGGGVDGSGKEGAVRSRRRETAERDESGRRRGKGDSLSAFLDRAFSAASDLRLDAVRTAECVDWTRTSSMSVWSVAFYTPAYMWLYRMYDNIFPKKTTFTVTARVLGSVVYSIPVNVAFFLYGTGVHHTLEWIDLWEERVEDAAEEEELLLAEVAAGEAGGIVGEEAGDEEEAGGTRHGLWRWLGATVRNLLRLEDATQEDELQRKMPSVLDEESDTSEVEAASDEERRGLRQRLDAVRKLFPPPPPGLPHDPPPYDAEMMLSKARLKIEMELLTTVTNSARMWIPINLFNFAVVPAHLRPFGLLFFSVFWNCYLSLVQHRDLPLPEMEVSKMNDGATQDEAAPRG